MYTTLEIDMKETRVSKIQLEARGGSQLDDCLKEALLMSIETGVPVRVRHNQYLYKFDGKKIISDADGIREEAEV